MQHRSLKDQLYAQFARIGKALASPKRLEILDLLSQAERSVEALAAEANLSVGNASAHLQVLHSARLVARRKEGQRVHYRLANPAVFRFFRDLQGLSRQQLAEVEQMARLYYESPGELEPVTSSELVRRLRDEDVLVLDVRPEEEYRAGHIPDALNVTPDELESRLSDLPGDREIVAYCRGPYCLFSKEAVELLRQQGYRARRLEIGFPDWRAQGYPVSRETVVA